MAVRLTKKRLQALNDAVSLDDVLYEKFRRLTEELDRKYQELFRTDRVVRVIQKRKDGFNYEMPILEAHRTDKGTLVVIGE